MKNREENTFKKYISYILDNISQFNIPISGVSQKGGIFEEIMGKCFINLLKTTDPQIQEIQSITSRINMNKITLRNIKETRQKEKHITFKETKIEMIR